ncbi:hypothetical protein CYG68_21135 [Morganella morganii]|uniref:Uncharacterized protein n=1 Tax=Morganella morganii TaxID=582 RepID=A0A8I0Q8X9_MORMO|nr:hypothetical protein [Morganella morganii]MBE8614828.1 hypothetical protein [Morganella morganii]
MADKKEIKPADIHNCLIRTDLNQLSTEELQRLCGISICASDGIMAGLKAMGECAFWACANENYSDSQAKDDLRRISESLMYLPRIAEALASNADNAQFLIYQREGFPYTEVNNG